MSHINFLYHVVCATKERRRLIGREWESDLFGVIGGIVRGSKGKLIEINGIEDHLHMLIRLGATLAFSDFMRELKKNHPDLSGVNSNRGSTGNAGTEHSR